jgi:transposase
LIKRIALEAVAVLFVAGIGLELGAATAYANKVDCAKVMSEVGAGKKTKDIAKELSISTSSVYRCKSKAKAKNASAKTASAASPTATASPSSHK